MEIGIIKAMPSLEQRTFQTGANIFLPSIFLSNKAFHSCAALQDSICGKFQAVYRNRVLLFFFFSLWSASAFSQTRGFEIIYLADTKYAADSVWVNKIKSDWSATGINLRLKWAEIENDAHGLDWKNVDAALKMLERKKLDIYIRVSFIFTRPNWFAQPGYYTNDDFHRRWDGEYYLNPYILEFNTRGEHSRLLTFLSSNGRARMKEFYRQVLAHLNQQPLAIKRRLKLIVPALSQDDESEYPSHAWIAAKDSAEMSGYGRPEQEAFVKFLQAKYNNDSNQLNRAWVDGANFGDISAAQIKIADYKWHRQQPLGVSYVYPRGRKDWMDFKTGALKEFLDELAGLTKTVKFKFGLQFGSFYGNDIVYRGFYDPTVLLEKADFVITDDVVEYEPNFKFSADYSRSLGRFWDWKNSRPAGDKIKFATEANWPEYNGHSPLILTEYWNRQLRAFYERGGAALFVSHWGTSDIAEAANVVARLKDGKLRQQYPRWAAILKTMKGAPLQNLAPLNATHLSCEQALYFRGDSGLSGSTDYFYNNGFPVGKNPTRYEFPLFRFFKSRIADRRGTAAYEQKRDVITNYMLVNSPAYVTANYRQFHLTATSYIMPASTYQILQRRELKNVTATNDTLFRAKARIE